MRMWRLGIAGMSIISLAPTALPHPGYRNPQSCLQITQRLGPTPVYPQVYNRLGHRVGDAGDDGARTL